MGLLDAIGSDQGGGGLLDALLRSFQQNSDPAQMAQMGPQPSDTAQYAPMQPPPVITAQPSPLDNARWPVGPIGAPSQANAQGGPPVAPPGAGGNVSPPQSAAQPPAAGPAMFAQPQSAPQDPGMSLGDRLGAGFRGMVANAPTGPLGAIFGGIAGISGMGKGTLEAQEAKKQGFAANALLQKGVDPVTVQAAINNPEMMKTLITQNFGPQTVTALGNGYVADKSGNIKRAYEPEDKIPAGFAKDDKGNMKFIPGGPADPAYLRLAEVQKKDPSGNYVLGHGGEVVRNNPDGSVTVLHKNEAEKPDANLDDASVKAMASQYLAGDKTVKQNLGRGAQGSANLVKLNNEIYNQANAAGLDGKAIVNNFNEQAGNLAGQRSIGTRSANISLAANEANNMIPIALEASGKVPRGEWMPWNKMVQAYQTGTSSPELARFVAATNSLVNSYVRAVSPSGVPTDSMREHAYSMLNSAQSPQAYQAVTSIMQDEMKAAMAAPAQVRKELRHDDAPAADVPKAPVIDQTAIEAEMKRRGLL